MKKQLVVTILFLFAISTQCYSQYSIHNSVLTHGKHSRAISKKKNNKQKDTTVSDTSQDDTIKGDTTWTGEIFGSGSLSGLEDLSNAKSNPNSNISLGGLLRRNRLSVMFAWNPKAASSPDSATLSKTFLFPQINSRAYVFGVYCNISKDNPVIFSHIFMNFSYSTIKDTNNHIINPVNFAAGFKFTISKNLKDNPDSNVQRLDHIAFSLQPYYSLVSVDPKDFSNYNALFPTGDKRNNLPPTLHTVGGRFEFELGGFMLFADGKYVINKIPNSNFNNFSWTIGANINTTLFKF